MKLSDFYNEVSRRTDTKGTRINVAETKRVLSEAFAMLGELGSDEATAVIASGIRANKGKPRKR